MAPVLRKRTRPAGYANGTPPKRKARASHTSNAEELNTIGDLIEARANESELEGKPLVYYPSTRTEYVGYTAADICTLSNKAATYYSSMISRRTSSDEPPQVVALLGPSNFDYLIGMLGLGKLGHTVLFLSTRISEEAHLSLLTVTKAQCLLIDDAFEIMGEKLQKHLPHLMVGRIASRDEYDTAQEMAPSDSVLDPARERNNVALIIHSSGSTSLPKPNYQTHAAALGNFKSQFSLVGFITMPLFHMQGLGCVFRSIMNRKPIYMYNASLPLTSQHLITTLREHLDIQILYGVPYAMKLLASSEEGIVQCRRLEVLFCGGGATPKPIGDKLVREGVYLVSHVGSSEVGQLMNSYRPRSEIEEWDWLRPSAALERYSRWEPYDTKNAIYELVILDGWPTKVATNRDDGSYATNDLWERHPDFPQKNAWRYYARKDDTIVLENGEKANPLLFEDLVRESHLVDDAIVFGSQKPRLGMFIVASDSSTESDIIQAVWPLVEGGNIREAAHAQISKDMIRLVSQNDVARIRKTDKAAIIRAAFYRDFSSQIDAMYAEPTLKGSLRLDETGLRSFLRDEIEALVQIDRRGVIGDDTDLFSFGIDSLQSSRLRSAILKNIDTGGEFVGENFVFEHPSIHSMADMLFRMRKGIKVQTVPVEDRMRRMINKYSLNFARHSPGLETPSRPCVVLTGATGSLGIHVLSQLAKRQDIARIYCLIRATSHAEADKRLQISLDARRLTVDMDRIRTLAADLSEPKLGLSQSEYADVSNNLSNVFHCAWSVNFNFGLESFEDDCIRGTRHLIDLCLASRLPAPAGLVFCSSISAAGNSPSLDVAEELPATLAIAQNMGYAQSKLVAEHICFNATKATAVTTSILRVGQIIGDTQYGIWNRSEAIPMILRSAKTIGALPKLDEELSWLPVDTVATAIVQICWSDRGSHNKRISNIYHVVNQTRIHWTNNLLPLLRSSGLEFDTVDPQEWLRRLRNVPDPAINPPYRLIEFFNAKYGGNVPAKNPTYLSDHTQSVSVTLQDPPKLDQEFVNKMVQFITFD